jgi:hypothetical protein
MHIDKYETEDGYECEGLFYRTAEDFIQSKIIGFCCCGEPEASLQFVMSCLTLVEAKQSDDFSVWRSKVKTILPNEGIEYFVWYALDKAKLTEHDSMVPGRLTPVGKEVLEDLTEMFSFG